MKKVLMFMSLVLCSLFIITGCGNEEFIEGNGSSASGSTKEMDKANVGDVVVLGNYEQDNDTSNGKEQIEWIVLEKKDDKLLVLSKHGLDAKEYYKDEADITWEQSIVRTWLNDEFLKNAFSTDEQLKIIASTVEDKIFLLSLSEARTYLDINGVKECMPTEYAIANGAGSTSKGYAWWWLRSVQDKGLADYLYFAHDEVQEGQSIMSTTKNSVRPAIWVTID